ncbi:MAG: DNA alkylation repair protein [Deltaproteobacteria bacterium]|nr:DNA alkylation repair protein [Deltaproteobacteria bacterium]
MAEPFKNLVNAESIARIGQAVAAVAPFDAAGFERRAVAGLEPLELKARIRHVAGALRAYLPGDWRESVRVLLAALPEQPPAKVADGLTWWPLLQLVETHGLDHPETSLAALRVLTCHASAEFAVRPYLERHPDLAWAHVDAWSRDPSEHVRRLASEGTRPRLPWASRLDASVRDPARGLAIIERLVDDPSEYVRRSVANHLGDVAKDHPALAVEVARRWLPGRRRLVEHALRDLLKKGHPAALDLLGHKGQVEVSALGVDPPRARPGEAIEVTATITGPGTARVDVVWAWPGTRGWSSKTFRGAVRELSEGDRWHFRQRLSMRPVTTRPLRPGEQRVFLRVNGIDHGPATFLLLDADPPRE